VNLRRAADRNIEHERSQAAPILGKTVQEPGVMINAYQNAIRCIIFESERPSSRAA
jgi:hypothetical protein